MREIMLENLKYEDVQESFGMGGPYLGELKINGKKVRNKFLVDNEKYSANFKFICLVQYKGRKLLGKNFLKIFTFQVRKKDFRIVLINSETEEIFESNFLGEALFVEKMQDNKIIYFEAFHYGIEKFKREIEFNDINFKKVNAIKFYK